MQRVVLSVTNDISIDQRMHKVCSTLVDAGYEVLLVGRLKSDSLALKPQKYNTHRLKMWYSKGKLFYLEYNIRLFFFLLNQKVDIITSNDLDTLLAGYLASRIKHTKLVYDTHEYFTELPELAHRPKAKAVWTRLEKLLFPRVDAVSTVNQSLAAIYQGKYNKKVEVIRNLPYRQSSNTSTPTEPKENIVIYQGNVNVSRGIDIMLHALTDLPEVEFWIVGPGDLLESMKKMALSLGVSDRTKFWGQIPFQELVTITRQAKIGISIEQPIGLNSTLCLPNKLSDYIQLGIPVIVSDLPEIRRVVSHYQTGIILENNEPSTLVNAIRSLLNNEKMYTDFHQNALIAANDLCWEREKDTLIAMYKNLKS